MTLNQIFPQADLSSLVGTALATAHVEGALITCSLHCCNPLFSYGLLLLRYVLASGHSVQLHLSFYHHHHHRPT